MPSKDDSLRAPVCVVVQVDPLSIWDVKLVLVVAWSHERRGRDRHGVDEALDVMSIVTASSGAGGAEMVLPCSVLVTMGSTIVLIVRPRRYRGMLHVTTI